jgi:putative transposase
MVRKAFKSEQIINKLREAEVLLSQGLTVGEASRKLGVTEQTCYRWRKEYGGMWVEQARATQRLRLLVSGEEARLVADITELSTRYGRYGYRRITALLNNNKGWQVNHKRVERIWRIEEFKVPKKQSKRGRLWLNDGSCIRLRPEHKDHVWSYDFVTARTSEGRAFKLLTLIDEYTRECLAILVERHITSEDVINQMYTQFLLRGVPEHIRSDNGPEFTAKAIRSWLAEMGVKTLFIEPGSPWENGYIESFNGKLRDELLDREIFTTLTGAKVLITEWRKEYNQVRPHSAKGYKPPTA